MLIRAGGSQSAPTHTLAGWSLGRTGWRGWTSDNTSGQANNDAAYIDVSAASDFSASNQETVMSFGTTSPGAYSATTRMLIGSSGYVGIGTINPQHLLHVAGTVGAESVIVSATGADYVFDSGYRLAPLSEVANYIKANHHLPEIPSATEVETKGVDLGEMQSKLLAKVEELTLHMIQLEKENRDLTQRLAKVEARR